MSVTLRVLSVLCVTRMEASASVGPMWWAETVTLVPPLPSSLDLKAVDIVSAILRAHCMHSVMRLPVSVTVFLEHMDVSVNAVSLDTGGSLTVDLVPVMAMRSSVTL